MWGKEYRKNKYEQSESTVIALVASLVVFAIIGFMAVVGVLAFLIDKAI